MADNSTWRRKLEPVHRGEKKGSELLFKDGNTGPGRLKVKGQAEARKVCPRTPPPMAASDRLSPSGEEVAGRSPEPSVSGTPRGQETSQTEIWHLQNMFLVSGSGQMHSLSRNLLGGGGFRKFRKLRKWKMWDPRNGSKSKRWQLFYRPGGVFLPSG